MAVAGPGEGCQPAAARSARQQKHLRAIEKSLLLTEGPNAYCLEELPLTICSEGEDKREREKSRGLYSEGHCVST